MFVCFLPPGIYLNKKMHMEKILLKKTLSIFLPYKGKPEPPLSTDRGWIKQVWYVHALEVHVTNKNDGKNFTED